MGTVSLRQRCGSGHQHYFDRGKIEWQRSPTPLSYTVRYHNARRDFWNRATGSKSFRKLPFGGKGEKDHEVYSD